MAAGGTYSIILDSGITISCYQAASQAVNSNPPCTTTGAAASTTTTTDFAVPVRSTVKDIIVGAALTAGGIEVYNVTKGQRTLRGWSNLETFLATNTTRSPAPVTFVPGNTYRFIQTVAGNA